MNRLSLMIGAAALLSLGGCMDNTATGRNGHAADVPAAKVVGESVSCIPIVSISESRVRDDWTIDFKVGSKWYRNALPNRCSSLGFEKAFSYSTSLSQLCSTDIIHPLVHVGGGIQEQGACGLGQFTPVELAK